jgi:O-antigen/teichoic acid export membrane protein
MSASGPAPAPRAHSTAKVLRNTLALAVGRNLTALMRLGLLAIVARGLGTGTFGQYALLIALLMVAEGLLDFGSNEIFVREVAAHPERRTELLRTLLAGRLLHAPAAWALMVGAAVLLGYERSIIEATAVGGLSLLFLGGVMVFRVIFRTELTMEREIVGEFVSVSCMVALLLWLAQHGGDVVGVMVCHAVSRAVFFGCVSWLGRREFSFSLAGVTWADLVWSWRNCAAVGTAGFLVMLYDPMDVLLLSRLGGFGDTAHFAAAQRLAWPLLITLSTVGNTLYSVVAAAWPHDRPRLERACQYGFDSVIVFGIAAVTGAIAGAEFLLKLIGPEMVAGAPAFGVLVVLCVVKSISMTLGPVLLVVGAQRIAMGIIGTALLVKTAACFLTIPRFGFVGLAWTALAVEVCFVAIPALVVVTRRAEIHLRYGLVLRAAVIGAATTVATRSALGPHGIWPALAAPALYVALMLASRTVRLSDFRLLRAPGGAG